MAKPILLKALKNQWGTTAFKKQNVFHFAKGSLNLSKNENILTNSLRLSIIKFLGSVQDDGVVRRRDGGDGRSRGGDFRGGLWQNAGPTPLAEGTFVPEMRPESF